MSDSLKEDQIKDLKEVWEGFQKACDEKNKFIHIISISKEQFLKDQDKLIPIFTGVYLEVLNQMIIQIYTNLYYN